MAEGDASIDLYADVDHEFSHEEQNQYSSGPDLFDQMVQPSQVNRQSNGNHHSNGAFKYNFQGKKYSVYVGNLQWWTSDLDLMKLIQTLGVNDIIEIKFMENRSNGQSKGYALVHFMTEASSRIVMEKLPHRKIHERNPQVSPYNRQSLNQFEQQSSKNQPSSNQQKSSAAQGAQFNQPPQVSLPINAPPVNLLTQSTSQTSILGPPPALPNAANIRVPPPVLPQVATSLLGHLRPPLNVPPPTAGAIGIPPPNLPPPVVGVNTSVRPPNIPQALFARLPPPPIGLPPVINTKVPPPSLPMGIPPPGLQGVPPPNMLPQMSNLPNRSMPPPQLPLPSAGQQQDAHQQNSRRRSPSPGVSGAVAEEAMIRNRAVSSTAMTRAVADASSGDYSGAVDTLLTAISLLKQSKLANDDRTRVLIGSLKDCLHGIEDQKRVADSSNRKRERPYEREERSRYRESKSRRRDHRDRSRSRERSDYYHRDRSRDRDSSYRHHERHRR